MTKKHFAIVGGGIGGLSLAIALQRKGFNATIYESAPSVKPLGAGLTLAGNAVKALIQVGIADPILKAGKILGSLSIKDQKGKVLTQTNAEYLSKKFGVINSFSIHRADLQNILIEQLQPGTLQLGKHILDFHQTASGVMLYFDDGSSVSSDYMIACDGIHSPVRKKLLPLSQTRYSGYTCWRAVIIGKSPTAQRMLKYSFNLLDDGLVGQQLFAGETTRLAYMTDEAQEGRDQFLQKREPDWSPYPWYY